VGWCDKLASTPAFGLRLDKRYAPVASLLDPLADVVSRWVDKENDRPAFTVDQPQDLFSSTLTTFDGYQYMIGPESLAVEFKHRMRFRAQSAGPPTAELLSKAAPYTEVLEDVSKRLLEMTQLVTAGIPRKLLRIGVVSTTVVAEDEMPPGIRRFLHQVTKPWDASLDHFHIELTTKLSKGKQTARFDRCTHLLMKPEHAEQLITVRLDWQRFFPDDRLLSMSALPELVAHAKADALAYFEDIGEGARFDE
jgi:hypothetical protein